MSLKERATYPLAPSGIFWSHQGEGHLRGFGMVFLRLATCSVGCAGCDTDYSVAEKLDPVQIAIRVMRELPRTVVDRWVWVTGGEPADFDLRPLLSELRKYPISIAVATSGHKRVIPPVDWLSVTPHDLSKQRQRYGNEVKIVDQLDHNLDDFNGEPDVGGFMYRYVQPLSVDGKEDPESLERCKRFLQRFPHWALSRQDHVHWGLA